MNLVYALTSFGTEDKVNTIRGRNRLFPVFPLPVLVP